MKSLAHQLASVLAHYGGWGLVAISALDSSFVPMPGMNDLLLIHLSTRFPLRMPLYVLATTAGSVLGAYGIFGLGYGGRRMVRRSFPPERSGRARRWLERNDFLSVMVISLLPPPAPFKLFLVTAGAMRVRPWRLGLALVVGRALRFLLEGFFAVRYGEQAEAYLKAHFVGASLVLTAAVVLVFLIVRMSRKPPKAHGPGTVRS